MAFLRPYLRPGSELPAAENIVILNSATVQVGDAMKLSAGGVEPADAAADRPYGLCVGINLDGIPLSQLTSGSDYDGTYTEATGGVGDIYAAASDNQTDKLIVASVVPIPGLWIEADLDAARGTTTGSDVVGYYMDILTTDSSQLDESTASTSTGGYLIVKNHPTDANKSIVTAVEPQIFN